MKTHQTKNNIVLKIVSFIMTLIIVPFSMIPLIFKKILGNLILALIISLLVFFLSDFGFFIILLYSLAILVLISIVTDYRLIHESFITQYDSICGNFRFSSTIQKFRKNFEKFKVSPIISKQDNEYRVVEYGTYSFDPRDDKKLTGFIVLEEKGNLINDKEIANEIVNLYLLWRHIYFNPVLGDYLKKDKKPLLKFWINFQNKFKEDIEKREQDKYKQVSTIKDKEFVKILKDLDDEVIKQYPFVSQKLNLALEIFDKIYFIFLRPSAEFYEKIYNKIDKIAKISQEENKVWTKRLKTWENLYEYKEVEINKLPDPSFKWIGRGVLADFVNHAILKQQLYPIGGATIVGLTVEGGKMVRKKTLRYLNKYLTYHKFGIDAIKQNIEMNNKLKEIRDKYKQILSSNMINKIRNFN